MKNLFISELLKTKRSPFLLLIIALPLILNGVFFINFFALTPEEFDHKLLPGDDRNPWFGYYKSFLFLSSIIFPLVISVLTYVVKNIEDRAKGWRSLLTLPKPIITLYAAKFFVILFYCLIYLVLSLGLLLLSAEVLSFLKPDFHFGSYPRYVGLIGNLFLYYLLIAVAISSLTYALVICLARTMAGLLLSVFIPFLFVLIEFPFNPYSQAFTQTVLPIALRSSHIRTFGNADTFQFSLSLTTACWYLLGWILLAWWLLYMKSKRPAIDYN
jgi:hypothetical protein